MKVQIVNQAFSNKKRTVKLYKKHRGKEVDTNIEINEEDIVKECPGCKNRLLKEDIKENMYVCPVCQHHFGISNRRRLKMLVDSGTFKPIKFDKGFINPLDFPEYGEKIRQMQEKTGLSEGATIGTAKIDGNNVVVAVLSASFLMGSMGMIVGEMITVAIETAKKKKYPLIIFSASGGARMQEGIMSLMQMAKTSAALEEFKAEGGLYISYLTHPTTGGVSASFAFLGDIMLAEPKALIGFAGPRVIKQTIKEELPEGFQRSEYLLEHGFLDKVVPRENMRECISQILRLHKKGAKLNEGRRNS